MRFAERKELKMGTSGEPLTQTIRVTMPGKAGFHLRAAARFVACMQEFRSSIRIRRGEVVADGKSILGLLALGAGWKSKLEIEAVGDDAIQAIEGAEDFFRTRKRWAGDLKKKTYFNDQFEEGCGL